GLEARSQKPEWESYILASGFWLLIPVLAGLWFFANGEAQAGEIGFQFGLFGPFPYDPGKFDGGIVEHCGDFAGDALQLRSDPDHFGMNGLQVAESFFHFRFKILPKLFRQ